MDIVNRGSEWRKWDLHIHSNASDGNASPSEIIDEAISKEISVIALTDHHTVKNVEETKQIGKERGIEVIAGIEFRTEYGNSSVHIIGLFPDDLNCKSIYENILCQLGLSEDNITKKGKKDDKSKSDKKAFQDGMFLMQVDFKKAANLIHKYGGLVSVHAGCKENSLEQMKHQGTAAKNVNELYSSLGTLKEELMKEYIDICEIGKGEDGIFYFKEFKKPSIIASDSHEKNKIGNKFTWIKADPTFEGLKQILYEPNERIKIQQNKPDDRKGGYQVIDSVLLEEDGFWKETIYLNENLNTIIGGRSTGKSILLKSIAKKINKNDFDGFIEDHLSGVTVKWKDENKTADRDRGIDFFRQSYMYEIAKDEKEKK